MTIQDDLAERVGALEAKEEIRRLMAAYVIARDTASGPIGDYFTDDAVWEGLGRLAETLGRQEGRDAIVRRFAGLLPPAVHLLGNESISVDGDEAVGYWTFLQLTVAEGRALWVAARYQNDFRRQDGRWRIRHLRVDGIFQAPYDRGWAETDFFRR